MHFFNSKKIKVITSGRPEPRFWVHLAKKSPFGSHKVKLIWSTNCGLYMEHGLNILQIDPLLE